MTILTCVVTHERLPYTRRCIESLLATWRPGDAIVVVDNASTDGTAAWLNSLLWPRRAGMMRVVLNRDNVFPGAATNQGWASGLDEAATYGLTFDLLHRSDNDIEYREGWQAEVEAAFLANERLALLGILNLHEDRGVNADHETGIEPVGQVGGNVVLPRRLWDLGMRWSERPWAPDHGEDAHMSQRAYKHGFVARLRRTVADNMAFCRYDDFPSYYDRTAAIRGIPDARRSV